MRYSGDTMVRSLPDFQFAFEQLPAPAVLLDCDLVVRGCNAAYEQLVNRSRDEMLGQRFFELFPGSAPEQSKQLRRSFTRALKTGKPHHLPRLHYGLSHPRKKGFKLRAWTASNVPLVSEDRSTWGIMHCPTDITHLSRLTKERRSNGLARPERGDPEKLQALAPDVEGILHAERDRLQKLFQQAPGFICVLRGPHHIFELANDAYYQLVGHREIIGHVLAQVLPEVVSQGFLEKLDRVYRTGIPFIGRALPIELQRTPDGDLEQRYIDLIYQPILDEDGKVSGIFVQGNDVTEAYTLTQQVTYQAAHDSLTGLFNRREFARRTRELDTESPYALLYMDVDHFKVVNDRCGHAAGDQLLLEAAEVLRAHCNEDDLLARLGGDEFALIRRDCDEQSALDLANHLRRAVGDINFVWQKKRYGVTLSVGLICVGNGEHQSFDGALASADAACFLAKEKGRNRVQLSIPSDDEICRQQRDMDNVSRIKDAISEDRLVLFAQRIFDLGADPGALACYEVLTRLQDTDGRLAEPGGFIPAAERFGLIEELDRHIIRKAFGHLQKLHAGCREGTCYFINLSGITLSAPGFPLFVEATLISNPNVDPSRICFEVTETAAVSNIRRTAAAMEQLIGLGFRFALDDFGSGMATFSYLQQLPDQYVKIDGEFVRGIRDQPASPIIVESVVRVAASMNIKTIAEYVESEDLVPLLKSLGVDFAQGYALHRPQPIQPAERSRLKVNGGRGWD